MKIAVLAGDGIGPEIMAQACRVLELLRREGLKIEIEEAIVGGAAYDRHGDPLPEATLRLTQQADAVLFGAVGGPQYDALPRPKRPERSLLRLRKALDLFANLRPAILYPELAGASTLKAEVVAGLDLMIVRELTGDIYFAEPRGISRDEHGERVGVNTMRYSESEIRRIAHVGFKTARRRSRRLCSVDKMNVLETTQLWRDVVSEVASEYPDIELTHMLVDNAAMQLVRNPRQFDVLVTTDRNLRYQQSLSGRKLAVLVLPTTGTTYTIEEVQKNPIQPKPRIKPTKIEKTITGVSAQPQIL